MTEAERKAAWYLAHRDENRARARRWYLANREQRLADAVERYKAQRLQIIAYKRAHRRTAAGMLASARHHAKERGH